jgi:predicted nucleotidyltransferase
MSRCQRLHRINAHASRPSYESSALLLADTRRTVDAPEGGTSQWLALSGRAISSALVKPSKILQQYREVIRRIIAQGPLSNPRVFGSVVRGDDREGSDLDLLVDASPGTTLFDLGGLQADLEEALGVRVDLLTPDDLPPRIRERVLREAKPV